MNESVDLIVIGAGPAGEAAAIKASEFNQSVLLIEKAELGGTCLNRGCIPTKVALHASEIVDSVQAAENFGIKIGKSVIDYQQLNKRKDEVITQLQEGIAQKLKAKKIQVVEGEATILSSHQVKVHEVIYKADKILVATGSKCSVVPILGLNDYPYLTSDDLLKEIPPIKNLTILGGGVIGCEFASFYHSLGAEVTIIEYADRLLPILDKEIGQSLKLHFKKKGIQVYTSTSLKEVTQNRELIVESKGEEKRLPVDTLLVATGRKANYEGLLDEGLQFECEKGRIVVDDNYETSIPGIYAVGDVSSLVQLAHVASAQGILAVEKMMGEKPSVDCSLIPSCVYTQPEIACVGISVEQAKERGIEAFSVKVPMGSNGKTVLSAAERGFMKVIVDKNEKCLLGAVFYCQRATDMISLASQLIESKWNFCEEKSIIYPHPTYIEAFQDCINEARKKIESFI